MSARDGQKGAGGPGRVGAVEGRGPCMSGCMYVPAKRIYGLAPLLGPGEPPLLDEMATDTSNYGSDSCGGPS